MTRSDTRGSSAERSGDASHRRFRIERTANGHTREIELDAADESDARRRAAALHSHQRGPATYLVTPI